MSKKKKVYLGFALVIALLLAPRQAFAMHIMEGFLPAKWCIFWYVVFAPFFIYSIVKIKKIVKENPETKVLLALSGAFIFVLSALKIPSVTGSCSHPTGVGLGVSLFGPGVISILGTICLLFQAIFLAHGGLTTLGANAISMAVVGPFVGYAVLMIARKLKINASVGLFLCAVFADLATYLTTSIQLGVVFPDPSGGIAGSIVKFMAIFMTTQIPIAIAEGFLTVIVYNLVSSSLPLNSLKGGQK